MSESSMLVEGGYAPSDNEWRDVDMMIAEFQGGIEAKDAPEPLPVDETVPGVQVGQGVQQQEQQQQEQQQQQQLQQQLYSSQGNVGGGALPISADPGMDSLYNENVGCKLPAPRLRLRLTSSPPLLLLSSSFCPPPLPPPPPPPPPFPPPPPPPLLPKVFDDFVSQLQLEIEEDRLEPPTRMSTDAADPLSMEVEDVGLTLETVCSSNDVLALAAAEAAEAAAAADAAAAAAAAQVGFKPLGLKQVALSPRESAQTHATLTSQAVLAAEAARQAAVAELSYAARQCGFSGTRTQSAPSLTRMLANAGSARPNDILRLHQQYQRTSGAVFGGGLVLTDTSGSAADYMIPGGCILT